MTQNLREKVMNGHFHYPYRKFKNNPIDRGTMGVGEVLDVRLKIPLF